MWNLHNYFTEMCSGSEANSYLRLIDFWHHLTLGLRVIKKKKKICAKTHIRSETLRREIAYEKRPNDPTVGHP